MKKNRLYKITAASILIIMIFSTFIGATTPIKIYKDKSFDNQNFTKPIDDYTHTVMVEACTGSTCGPCGTAASVMRNIYYSGEYDYYYVALVYNKNNFANGRCSELGVSSIPDYVFDGDYTRWVGSGGLPYSYQNRLDLCGARSVEDIDMSLDMTWNGDSEFDIDLSITNNEGSAYNGHVHAYVTEIVSRWYTAAGQPYDFAMIGNYAFNQNIDIGAGDTETLSTTWDGSIYGFNNLDKENIMVIATIFNRNNNFYSDETTALSFAEIPPELEINIKSTIGGVSADITNIDSSDLTDLEWSISVTGGILNNINVNSSDIIDNLAIDETTTIKTDKIIFGLGKIDIELNVDLAIRTKTGLVIGPIIILL